MYACSKMGLIIGHFLMEVAFVYFGLESAVGVGFLLSKLRLSFVNGDVSLLLSLQYDFLAFRVNHRPEGVLGLLLLSFLQYFALHILLLFPQPTLHLTIILISRSNSLTLIF